MTASPQPPQSLDVLKQQVEKAEAEAKAKGLPFNQQSYLRRMAQGKNQYYDSAEFVLRNGWPGAQQKQAYFDTNIPHAEQQKQLNQNSRFKGQVQNQEEDDDE